MLLAAVEGSGEDPAVHAGAMGGQAADGGEAAPASLRSRSGSPVYFNSIMRLCMLLHVLPFCLRMKNSSCITHCCTLTILRFLFVNIHISLRDY